MIGFVLLDGLQVLFAVALLAPWLIAVKALPFTLLLLLLVHLFGTGRQYWLVLIRVENDGSMQIKQMADR